MPDTEGQTFRGAGKAAQDRRAARAREAKAAKAQGPKEKSKSGQGGGIDPLDASRWCQAAQQWLKEVVGHMAKQHTVTLPRDLAVKKQTSGDVEASYEFSWRGWSAGDTDRESVARLAIDLFGQYPWEELPAIDVRPAGGEKTNKFKVTFNW